MNFAFVAQVIFYISFFAAWVLKEIPQTPALTIAAFAALVAGVLLVVSNSGAFSHR